MVRLDNASLASQAVGPPLNAVEMSFDGRSWARLGRKMLALTPLGRQQIAQDDSVLGRMANVDGPGLAPEFSYAALVRSAFRRDYWGSAGGRRRERSTRCRRRRAEGSERVHADGVQLRALLRTRHPGL